MDQIRLKEEFLSRDLVTYDFVESAKVDKKAQRKGSWRLAVAGGALMLGMSVSTFALPLSAVVLEKVKAPIRAKLETPPASLADALRNTLARIGSEPPAPFDSDEGPTLNRESLRAAERILGLLPPISAHGKVGLDDEGCVYFHFQNGAKHAYLTVEPHTLHLLVRQPGQDVRRLDNVQFKGSALPERVRKVLQQNLRA